VVDVVPGDLRLMEAITFQSNEIHVVVRDKVPGATLKDWRARFANSSSHRSRKVLAVTDGHISSATAEKTPHIDRAPIASLRRAAKSSAKTETASSRCFRDRKRFELTVDRVLGDRIRSDSSAAQAMWS